MSQPSLFRPRQFPAETLAISAVAWSTDGAPSRTSKALATLGDSGSILVRRLPQPEAVPALDGEGERTVRYRVINGNGRLEDLHALGETHVVAKVAPADFTDLEAAAHTLSHQVNHRQNPLQEARATRALLDGVIAAGIPAEEAHRYIGEQLGLPRKALEERLKLTALPGEVERALLDKKLSATTAKRLVSLSEKEKAEALQVLSSEGRLTAKGLKGIRQARRDGELEGLPKGLFESPPPAEAEADDFDAAVRRKLQQGHDPLDLIARIRELAGGVHA